MAARRLELNGVRETRRFIWTNRSIHIQWFILLLDEPLCTGDETQTDNCCMAGCPHRDGFLNKTALMERLRTRFAHGKRDRTPLVPAQSTPVAEMRAGWAQWQTLLTDFESPHSVHV
jgi:hypothetical protein